MFKNKSNSIVIKISSLIIAMLIVVSICGCSTNPNSVKEDIIGKTWTVPLTDAKMYFGTDIMTEFIFYEDGTADYVWIENGKRGVKINPTYEIVGKTIVVRYGYNNEHTQVIDYKYKDGKIRLYCEGAIMSEK